MGIRQWFSSTVRIRIVSADVDAALQKIASAGVIMYNMDRRNELTVEMTIKLTDRSVIEKLLKPKGDEIQCLRNKGINYQFRKLRKRPILATGIGFFLALSLWLPTKVLFIRVTGNQEIPGRLILEVAAKYGICFGADRSAVRSERMKNALLEAMPELQWAGVNTSGCVAVITVRERQNEDQTNNNGKLVSSIVAVRDGVIESCTAEKGTALCKPGQSVIKGQKLISGYTDCGITIRAEAAEGEVYALTEYKLSVCTLSICRRQCEKTGSGTKYSLKIGKKRINFYKGSGISDTTCDRIYTEKYITLPGGFVLPIAIITEQYFYYDCEDCASTIADGLLSGFAKDYLLEQMVGGSILSSVESIQTTEGSRTLEGIYRCREMIGRVVKEEIIKPNEYDN